MNIKHILKDKLGLDWAIFYTLLGRSLGIPVSLLSILFIAKYLSPEEQGYYYTFGSIVALQVFFELGLTSIITQFVAHEASHLKWNGMNFEGEENFKSRLASLLRFCAKWYSVFAVFILFTLFVVGFIFFNHYDSHGQTITWTAPWIVLVIGTAINFLFAPLASFVEGLGFVKEMARIRLFQQIIHPLVLCGGLMFGLKLYVSGIDAVLRISIVVMLLSCSPIFKIIKSIWSTKIVAVISYKTEIFPLQWRIAVSWISGYFIFQLFNPVLFATEGAKVAGQMGLTLQALNALQALALSWISTKIPRLSGFISLKQYDKLDFLFKSTFRQVLTIGLLFVVLFVVVITALQSYDISLFGINFSSRFLPLVPLLLMAWSTYSMMPVNCWATYLRCHKKEPLMLNSVVMGLLCCSSTFLLGNLFGLMGIVIGFAALRLLSLLWIRAVYIKKKKEWH